MSQIAVFDDILGSKFEPSKVQGTENNQLEFPYKMIQFVTSLDRSVSPSKG